MSYKLDLTEYRLKISRWATITSSDARPECGRSVYWSGIFEKYRNSGCEAVVDKEKVQIIRDDGCHAKVVYSIGKDQLIRVASRVVSSIGPDQYLTYELDRVWPSLQHLRRKPSRRYVNDLPLFQADGDFRRTPEVNVLILEEGCMPFVVIYTPDGTRVPGTVSYPCSESKWRRYLGRQRLYELEVIFRRGRAL